jgi:peroxiredoxin
MSCHFPVAAALAAAVLLLNGCGQSQKASSDRISAQQASGAGQARFEVKQASAESKVSPAADEPAARERTADEPGSLPSDTPFRSLDEVPDDELTMPRVLLSQAHAAKCKLQVDDQFPDFALADVAGNKQQLSGLLGDKLTVVCFWNGREPSALEELADLTPKFDRRFGKNGVTVVGINCGDDSRLAKELVDHAKAKFVNLCDRDGAAFAQVGTGRMPRTYLLDASGKILWFDIEYSHTTRRDLAQAIRFVLAER